MNLGEIRAAAERRSGVAYDTTAWNDLINEGLAMLSLRADWPWLQATYDFDATVDVGEQSLAAVTPPVRRIDGVNIDGYEGYLTSVADIDAWDTIYSTSRTGWAVRDGSLLFRPTQSTGTAISVRYIANEARLADDTDEPLLPEAYHDALVNLAAGLALERVGSLARAKLLTDRFEEWVRDMRRTAQRMGGNTGRIRVRPGGGL